MNFGSDVLTGAFKPRLLMEYRVSGGEEATGRIFPHDSRSLALISEEKKSPKSRYASLSAALLTPRARGGHPSPDDPGMRPYTIPQC